MTWKLMGRPTQTLRAGRLRRASLRQLGICRRGVTVTGVELTDSESDREHEMRPLPTRSTSGRPVSAARRPPCRIRVADSVRAVRGLVLGLALIRPPMRELCSLVQTASDRVGCIGRWKSVMSGCLMNCRGKETAGKTSRAKLTVLGTQECCKFCKLPLSLTEAMKSSLAQSWI